MNPVSECLYISPSVEILIHIDDFVDSVAILLGGSKSGQISIECRDPACDVEPPLLKIVRILSLNWRSNIYSQHHLQA